MKRYTLTTLYNLKAGDTFLKENDDSEIVYEVSEVKSAYKGMLFVKKGELRLPDMLHRNQAVIFLKHK